MTHLDLLTVLTQGLTVIAVGAGLLAISRTYLSPSPVRVKAQRARHHRR